MMTKIRHVLGISGGKDSAALAVYLKSKYPNLDIEYYFCDTGKELKETYEILDKLQAFLGKEIIKLRAAESFPGTAFDYYFDYFRGYLPSSSARWCTKKLKLEPFEDFVKDDLVISYVGIRGDENREGYISKKQNIQSIFPFRKNIWSKDVVEKVLSKNGIKSIYYIWEEISKKSMKSESFSDVLKKPISPNYSVFQKVNDLVAIDTIGFNNIVFEFLKTTNYPLSKYDTFPLLDNKDVIVKKDIFNILEDSGVGVPEYYKNIEFESNSKNGFYSRSRSGCFFCFFQQKIEWIWLYEQHPDLFKKAMSYEKEGFYWMQYESLEDLIKPKRIEKIKNDHIKKNGKYKKNKSKKLIDIIDIDENEGCALCFT